MDFWMVGQSDEDGGWQSNPETFDAKFEAKARAEALAEQNPGALFDIFRCELVETVSH